MNKEVVKFNHQEFKKAIDVFDKKVATEMAIDAEFTRLIKDYDYSLKSLLESPLDYFYASLEVVYKKQNTLSLKGEKLAELMQINTSNIMRLSNEYNSFRDVKKPTKEEYTQFAETPEEIKRLEYAKSYIALIKTFENGLGRVFPKEAILSHSPQVIFFNFRDNSYEPNLNFVKSIIQRGY
jgi:hypothetical protein